MHQAIDLGATNEERYGMSGPSPVSTSDNDSKKHYPSFRYSGDKELELPKDGEMTVEYCITEEVSSERDGKHHYECQIEVRKILDVKGEPDDDEDEQPQKVGDILDGLMAKLQKERE